MMLADERCTMRQCADEKGMYRMVGRCANCGAEPVLMLFTSRHETHDGTCPKCGNRGVKPQRLATDDEIPVA